jgi:excisionase family DNA binding protein
MSSIKPLLTPEQVCELLGVPNNTLNCWRSNGKGRGGPNYVKVGRLVRYRWEDVEAWLAKNTHTPETEA